MAEKLTLSDHFKVVLADLRDHGVVVGNPDAADGNIDPLEKVCESYGVSTDEMMALCTRFADQAQFDLVRLAMESPDGFDLGTVLRGIMAQSLLTGWRARAHAG